MAESRLRLPCPVCPACGGGRWRQRWRDADWRLLVCGGCGLGRVWPMPARERLEAIYDERYFRDNYLASRAARLDHFRRLWVSLAPLLAGDGRRTAPRGARGRLLDVGCGPGFFLEVAADHGWEAWGVEPSVAAEHVARPLRERVIHAPFGEDRLPEESFDAVTFWDVLAHLPDPAGALARAALLLRAGGLLVVKTPAGAPAILVTARLLGSHGRALLHLPQQVYRFTPAALRLLCGAVGFEELSLRRAHEAPREAPPAPDPWRRLARSALRLLAALLNPRPSLLLVARRVRTPGGALRAARG